MFKSAFCCMPLRTGALVTGWFRLVLGVVHIMVSWELLFSIKMEEAQDPKSTLRKINILRFDILVTALNLWGFICLIYGTYKNRAGFLVPYMLCSSIQFAEYIFLLNFWFFYCFSTNLHPLLALLGFLPLILLQYLFCVVGGHYMQLHSGLKDIKNTISAV